MSDLSIIYSIGCKKGASGPVQNGQREKSCEIKGPGGQEMAVVVWIDGKNFSNNNSGQFVLPHPSFGSKLT